VINKFRNNEETQTIKFSADDINNHFGAISGVTDVHQNQHQQTINHDSHAIKFTLKPINTFQFYKAWNSMKKRDCVTEDAIGFSNKMFSLITYIMSIHK